MPFEPSSAIKFAVYDLTEAPISTDTITAFADNAAPPIDLLAGDAISGWVSPIHLLDREITREKALRDFYLNLSLMKAELKVPKNLLKTYCKIEELAEMETRGVTYLNRQTRSDIKNRVMEELRPQMPPHLTAIEMAIDIPAQVAFIDATSPKQDDAFCVALRKTTGTLAVQRNPIHAAEKYRGFDVTQLDPTCFTNNPEITKTPNEIGMDFLMWLWHYYEERGGLFHIEPEGPEYAILLEGPATFFYSDAAGAFEASLRHGLPLVSTEAKSAIDAGKKLRSVHLTLACGKETYTAHIDGVGFTFSSVRLPKPEEAAYTAEEIFLNTMKGVQTFTKAFYHLYCMFLDERINLEFWDEHVEKMKNWLASRPAYS